MRHPKNTISNHMEVKRTYLTRSKTKKMKEKDSSTYLPPEIITEILARLPVQTILRLKCVCKSWLHLFETREFAKSHHSNSKSRPSGLALTVDENDNDKIMDDIHFNTVIKLSFKYSTHIMGSVDGFLLLWKGNEFYKSNLLVCNPITREYIDLLRPFDDKRIFTSTFYGFGVSKISGEYKVVGIIYDMYTRLAEECKVYTIGTGSWRSVAPPAKVLYKGFSNGRFVNGNLHWLKYDLYDKILILCFDLETEIFKFLSPPPCFGNEKESLWVDIADDAMRNTLCAYEHTSNYRVQFVIWLMKEYGVEESWTKQFVIGRSLGVSPLRICKDEVILTSHHNYLVYYSNKNKKSINKSCNFLRSKSSHSHTPSFLSLKYFTMENVLSF